MTTFRKPASTGRKSAVGQERREVYEGVWRSIKHAMDHYCWLEVIALSESVIADRLEARIAHLGSQSDSSRKVRTASQSACFLLISTAVSEEERQLYESVREWSKVRNKAVHELAKVIDGPSASWTDRWAATKPAAEEGVSLAKRVSKAVRKANRVQATKTEPAAEA